MKSVTQAHRDSGISLKLIRSVIRQLGDKGEALESTLLGVASNGADGGWVGFTYYKDTVAFYRRNKKDIVAHLKEQASDFGTGVIEMVGNSRCAKDSDATEDQIAAVLYGSVKGDEGDMIANCLAWYALEEVARAMTNE